MKIDPATRERLDELRARLLLERQTGMPRWNLEAAPGRVRPVNAASDVDALIEAEQAGRLHMLPDPHAIQHREELAEATADSLWDQRGGAA